jgi:hypothetical protein
MKWIAAALVAAGGLGAAITPELTTWMDNCDGTTGFNGILANVQKVEYGPTNVFVSSTGIPSHSIGPWQMNPNQASNQNHEFKIPRIPVPAVTKVTTPMGPIGAFVNGVPMFNTKDGMTYQNTPWAQNAVVVEAISMDGCDGHPQMAGMYHYHQVPECLRTELGDDGSAHSPILGWAFDGYPVYGPLGYSSPNDPNSAVAELRSSYRERSITQRRTLPDGTTLPMNQWGPNVSVQFPLGYYLQDFEYIAALGDLDEYNGRTCVTPEYPSGTYAYFATIDVLGDPAFPYILGLEYYGEPEQDNFPQGQFNIPPGANEYAGCLPENYCTAGTSANGCKASLSAAGVASTSTASGFEVTATSVEGQKDALFFFGANGRQAVSWGGGTSYQCIVPPVSRGGLLVASGTNGACDGTFIQDLNARWQAKPAQNPGVGATGQVQLWYRDPQNTSNQTTSLSDAIEYFVGP